MHTSRTLSTALVISTLVIAAGCGSRSYTPPPPPEAVRSDSLYEFSGEVAEAIADRIAQEERIAKSPSKVVIMMGNIENRTKGTDTSDFIVTREHLADKLTNSSFFRRQAVLLKDLKRMEAIKADISGATRRAPSADGTHTVEGITYDPEQVYVLDGFFGEMDRSNKGYTSFFFRCTLTHVRTAQEIFSQSLRSEELRGGGR